MLFCSAASYIKGLVWQVHATEHMSPTRFLENALVARQLQKLTWILTTHGCVATVSRRWKNEEMRVDQEKCERGGDRQKTESSVRHNI